MKRVVFYGSLFLICLIGFIFREEFRIIASPLIREARGNYTVERRLEQYGKVARDRWRPYFEKSIVPYPPAKVVFLGLKAERVLDVYASNIEGSFQLIRSFPVCAASGTNGPKLKDGDLQVPEGIYRVSFLNANSAYHLSLRVNYPNEFDLQKGKLDGRADLGGDIMIHGKCVSVGCLAMRDEAAEDLFVLSADVGIINTKVVLAPFDFRTRAISQSDLQGLPAWTPDLYKLIQAEFDKLPKRLETR